MPEYHFKALDSSGAVQSGALTAPSQPLAVEILVRRGLIATQLWIAEGKSNQLRWFGADVIARLRARDGISRRELLHATRSLAVLLRAGLTMDRALSISVALMQTAGAQRIVARLTTAVRAGSSLSQALAQERVSLPAYYSSMVQAGEAGGSLAETLARLSEALREQLAIRARVISALTYPLVLAVIVLATLAVLLTVVLPKFRVLFAESDVQLPMSTKIVLQLGDFVSQYWWAVLLSCSASAALIAAFMTTAKGRDWWDGRLLRAKWTFSLPLKLNTARVLRTLGTLLQSGVLLPNAVRIARGTLTNVHLSRALDEIGSRVSAGESLTGAFTAVRVFPALAVQLVRVGEESGMLQQLLLEAAAILDGEAQTSLERLLSVLVPLLTVGMGLIVATLIGSVLIGLLSINDLAM